MSRGVKGIKDMVKKSRRSDQSFDIDGHENYNFISTNARSDGLESMSKKALISVINDLRYETESLKSAKMAIQRNYNNLAKKAFNKSKPKSGKEDVNIQTSLQKRIDDLEETRIKSQFEYDSKIDEIKSLQKKMREFEENMKKTQSEKSRLQEIVDKNRIEQLRETNNLKITIAEKQAKISSLEGTNKDIRSRLDRNEGQSKTSDKLVDDFRYRVEEMNQKLVNLRKARDLLETRVQSRITQSERLERDLQNKNQTLRQKDDEIRSLTVKVNTQKKDIEKYKKSNSEFSHQIDAATGKLKSEINEKISKIQKLMAESKLLKSELTKARIIGSDYQIYDFLIAEHTEILALGEDGYVMKSKKYYDGIVLKLKNSQSMVEKMKIALKKKDEKLIEKQKRIESLEKSLQIVDEDLDEVRISRANVEMDIDKVKERLVLKTHQNNQLKKQYLDLSKRIDGYISNEKEHETKMLKILNDITDLRETNRRLKQNLDQLQNIQVLAESDEIHSLNQKVNDYVQKLKVEKSKVQAFDEQSKKLKEVQRENESLKITITSLGKDIERLEGLMKVSDTCSKDSESEIFKLKLDIEGLTAQRQTKDAQIKELQWSISEQRQSVKSLEAKIEKYKHGEIEKIEAIQKLKEMGIQQQSYKSSFQSIKQVVDVIKIQSKCQGCYKIPKIGFSLSPCLHYFCQNCKENNSSKCECCDKFVDFIFENSHLTDIISKYELLSETIDGITFTQLEQQCQWENSFKK